MVHMERSASFYKACGRSTHRLQGTPDHGVVTTTTLHRFVLAWEFTAQELSVKLSGFTLSEDWRSANVGLEDQSREFESEPVGLNVGDQIQDLRWQVVQA